MNNYRWIGVVFALLLAAGVGVMAYNAGVAHGIATSGKLVVAPYPWGFGFFFGPFFFFLLFFVVVRGLFWRGRWHHHRAGCRYGERERNEEAARP